MTYCLAGSSCVEEIETHRREEYTQGVFARVGAPKLEMETYLGSLTLGDGPTPLTHQ